MAISDTIHHVQEFYFVSRNMQSKEYSEYSLNTEIKKNDF